MALDYRTIRYVEKVGNSLHLHYIDGKTVIAVPNGQAMWYPGATTENYDGTYTPYVPPTAPPPPPSTGAWLEGWADGFTFTSGFGMRAGGMHYGIDISSTTAPTGLPILSVADMVVTTAVSEVPGVTNSTAGTYVKGHTLDGAYTFTYNHMALGSLAVSVGQTVTAGTQLGIEGQRGNVTGTHLHFEIIEGTWSDPWAPPYNNGAQFVDPLPILRAHGVNI